MKDPIYLRVVRWIFGAFYLGSGIQMALVLLGVLPMPPFKPSAASAEFQFALAKTGFVLPALALTFIAAGASLLFYRTAPLGIVLLAPAMVVIFFTNVLLDSAWPWATANLVILLALAWHFRAAYRPLWSYRAA